MEDKNEYRTLIPIQISRDHRTDKGSKITVIRVHAKITSE